MFIIFLYTLSLLYRNFITAILQNIMAIKLYSFCTSSCSYRVRICLSAKNINYEIIPVNLLRKFGEQYEEDYMKVNPIAQVPTLVDGNFALTQSMAIMEYLDEKYPDSGEKLFPGNLFIFFEVIYC